MPSPKTTLSSLGSYWLGGERLFNVNLFHLASWLGLSYFMCFCYGLAMSPCDTCLFGTWIHSVPAFVHPTTLINYGHKAEHHHPNKALTHQERLPYVLSRFGSRTKRAAARPEAIKLLLQTMKKVIRGSTVRVLVAWAWGGTNEASGGTLN